MRARKRIASLSLDLDNKWSYMKTHGDPGWESYPSYLDVAVPRILRFLKERDLTITFFLVGQDAALEKNHAALSSIAADGHEIGNHSFHHEPWLHLYTEPQVEREIAQAEEHVEHITGQKPLGFRGPGYSLSQATLKVLTRRGYLYDASTLPTFIGPLARIYYFMKAEFRPDEKHQRCKIFGTLRDGLRPIRPYRWRIDAEGHNNGLMEIPVTTMPILKIPIHVSYVLYISMFSSTLALAYFKMALVLCRLTGVQPSLLLHPLDFLGRDDVEELSFFPGMKLPSERKMWLVGEILRIVSDHFNVLTMQEHAHAVAHIPDLDLVEPLFPSD
jgi:peptidoglycan/xylan/chitin deacetylase (PgdA/CDA1 family)